MENDLEGLECGCGKQTIETEIEYSSNSKTGHVYITNNWGQSLSWINVRHRRSNSSSKEEAVTLKNLENKDDPIFVMDITYETGAASPFDYWYIKFQTIEGKQYEVKDNFYCSISSKDNGNVFLTISPEDVGHLYVSFSKSSGCYVTIKKI